MVHKYIPVASSGDVSRYPHAQWLNKSVLHKIRLKHKAWNKYKITQCSSDYLAYTKHRNDITEAVRNAKYCFEKDLIHGVSTNPKRFWKYVNSKTKVRYAIGELLKPDGTLSLMLPAYLMHTLVVYSLKR